MNEVVQQTGQYECPVFDGDRVIGRLIFSADEMARVGEIQERRESLSLMPRTPAPDETTITATDAITGEVKELGQYIRDELATGLAAAEFKVKAADNVNDHFDYWCRNNVYLAAARQRIDHGEDAATVLKAACVEMSVAMSRMVQKEEDRLAKEGQ